MSQDPFGLDPDDAETRLRRAIFGDDDGGLPQLPGDVSVPDDLSRLLGDGLTVDDLPGEASSIGVIAGIDPGPAAPYVTQVIVDDDTVIELPGDRAVRYGMAVLAAAHRAHYLAAVRRQGMAIMGRSGDPLERVDAGDTALFIVREVIADLPELDDEATAPLLFEPVVHRNGSGMVLVRRASAPEQVLSAWSFAEAEHHATAVLAQSIVSTLDSAYRTVIAVGFKAGEQKGRAAVADLGNFMEHGNSPVFADPDSPVSRRARFVPVPPKVPGPPPGAKPAGGRRRRRR